MIIKFRAWINEDDPKYSRMVDSEQAVMTALRHVYNGTGVANQSGFSDCDNQPHPQRYELMQYTGIKSWFNKKEIYRKDIVEFEITENGDYITGKGIVEFSNGSWVIECKDRIFLLGDVLDTMVCGNAYDGGIKTWLFINGAKQ